MNSDSLFELVEQIKEDKNESCSGKIERIIAYLECYLITCRELIKDTIASKNEEGMDIFMCLCQKNYEDFAIKLIDNNCVTYTNRDNNGYSCLIWAILTKSKKIILKLMEKEPSLIDIPCNKTLSPVIYAIKLNLNDIVLEMLKINHTIFDYVDYSGSTPLSYLIDKSHDVLQNMSLSYDYSCDEKNMNVIFKKSFLHSNIQLKNIIDYILENDIEVKIGHPNKNGDTALIFSIFVLNEELAIKLFNRYGEACNLTHINITGENALSFAIRNKMIDLLTLILDSSIDDIGINIVSSNNTTILMNLIKYELQDLIPTVLKRGFNNLDIVNKNYESALTIAISKGFNDIALLLLDYGCKFDYLLCCTCTPFSIACKYGMEDVVLNMISKKTKIPILVNHDFKNSAVYWVLHNKMFEAAKKIFSNFDQKLYLDLENELKKMLIVLKENQDDFSDYFYRLIKNELELLDTKRELDFQKQKEELMVQEQLLLFDLRIKQTREAQKRLNKQSKKKASKEKNKSNKSNNFSPRDINTSSVVEDSITILNTPNEVKKKENKDSDFILTDDYIKVESPVKNNNEEISNSMNELNFFESFNQLFGKKKLLEDWYFELKEEIKF